MHHISNNILYQGVGFLILNIYLLPNQMVGRYYFQQAFLHFLPGGVFWQCAASVYRNVSQLVS
jgi:hypothetical protein